MTNDEIERALKDDIARLAAESAKQVIRPNGGVVVQPGPYSDAAIAERASFNPAEVVFRRERRDKIIGALLDKCLEMIRSCDLESHLKTDNVLSNVERMLKLAKDLEG